MIYIYGDSHAKFSFKNLQLPHINCYEVSITMHRVGRDQVIPNFSNIVHDNESILIFAFGEVDCRCHIMRQKLLGRDEDEIISELVGKYFDSIYNNVTKYREIIITGVIPPTESHDYESINGPIKHEFPFVGTDEERARFTEKVNSLMEELCHKYNYQYFYPYDYYQRDNGCLKYELSDRCVHIGDNSLVLEQLHEILSDN